MRCVARPSLFFCHHVRGNHKDDQLSPRALHLFQGFYAGNEAGRAFSLLLELCKSYQTDRALLQVLLMKALVSSGHVLRRPRGLGYKGCRCEREGPVRGIHSLKKS